LQREGARHLSVEIMQLQNISLENPIVWHYLRDSTFSRFLPRDSYAKRGTCRRRVSLRPSVRPNVTDTHTDRRTDT